MPDTTHTPDPTLVRRFPRGQLCTVKGLRGRFRVTGWNRDGSVALYGGPAGRAPLSRSVMPERITRKRHDPAAVTA